MIVDNLNNSWDQSENIETDDFFSPNKTDTTENNILQTNIKHVGQMPDILNHENRKLLNALAKTQLDYGHPNEAIALLMLCRLNANDDLQTLQLLIRAYISLKWWDKADEISKELKYYSKNENPLIYMFNSLSLLGRFKFEQAREQFKIFYNSKQKVID